MGWLESFLISLITKLMGNLFGKLETKATDAWSDYNDAKIEGDTSAENLKAYAQAAQSRVEKTKRALELLNGVKK